jgi:dolichol-phosphate mannosyltransferase
MKKILVFTATYNEALNIERLIAEIFDHAPSVDVLVVDDNSPDGTGLILDRLSSSDSKIKVIHRSGKLGVGTAHTEGMKYALQNGYDALVTMDADFSHHPSYLPELLRLLETHDFVIGSRYVEGGGLGYGIFRTFLSRSANILARLLLSIKLHECTTSFRGFKRPILEEILRKNISSTGYSFFFEMVYLISGITDKVVEFPIYFADRTAGESKISKQEIVRGVTTLLRLFLRRVASCCWTHK